MVRVSEVMSSPAVTAGEESCLEDVARLMLANAVGAVAVVDSARAIRGILTAADFIPREVRPPFVRVAWRVLFGVAAHGRPVAEVYHGVRNKLAREVMSSPVITVGPDDDVDEAVDRMAFYKVDHLPVVAEGVPVGMVTRRDLLLLMT